MSRIALSTLHQITSIASKLDARLPKGFATQATELIVLDQKAKAYARNVRHISVADTILDSLASGSDPYDDRVVHEALMHAHIAQYADRVGSALGRRVELFLASTAEDVLRSFKPTIEKAGAALELAVEKLGDTEDLAAVLSKGGDAAQVWADARKAEETIERVLSLRKYLTNIGGSGVRDAGQYRALIIADIPGEDFTGQQLGNQMPKGWDIARNGWTFSLATPDELEARISRVLQAHSDAGVRRADAERAMTRNALGIGQPA